ncbi:MAG: hypothetical protein M1831_007367 [Alyxoria varia]|nr:MAG: hypothetical protein M1831_007367 [Alyxoria varia]
MPPPPATQTLQTRPAPRSGITFLAHATTRAPDNLNFPSDFKTNIWADSLIDNPTAKRKIDEVLRDDIKRKHGIEGLKCDQVKSVSRMGDRYTVVERFDWKDFVEERRKDEDVCVRVVYRRA